MFYIEKVWMWFFIDTGICRLNMHKKFKSLNIFKYLLLFFLFTTLCQGNDPLVGEYEYWSDNFIIRKILITKKGDTSYNVTLFHDNYNYQRNGEIIDDCLRINYDETEDLVMYLNGNYELRMYKIYKRMNSPEDLEWVFYRM